MKPITLFFGMLLLLSCSGGIKYGESGDDNSHLRNPQYPNNSTLNNFPKADSLISNNETLYILEGDLMVNRMFVRDSFILQKCFSSIGKPDSIHRGGPEIIAEFGVDDFDLFYGKSTIHAGHGQILMFEIRDKNLKINTISLGSDRAYFEKRLKLNFPNKDTLNCLDTGDGYYSFKFKNDVLQEIDYFAPSL